MVIELGTSGSVFSYNYLWHVSDANTTGAIFGNHNPHPAFNLFEGNIAPQIVFDSYHGSSSDSTLLRNWLAGTDDGTTYAAHAVQPAKYNRYINVVGNILGTAGFSDIYESYYTGSYSEKSVYKIGYSNSDQSVHDSVVYTTLLRHGNYDVVSKGIVWDPSITDHVLPNSYYLTGTPSWFGNLKWPPIDPASPPALRTRVFRRAIALSTA